MIPKSSLPTKCNAREKKDLFCCVSNGIENIHSKSVLAFQLAPGDMFRAQGHLLTPSELWDTALQSRQGLIYWRNPYVSYNRISLDIVESDMPFKHWTAVHSVADATKTLIVSKTVPSRPVMLLLHPQGPRSTPLASGMPQEPTQTRSGWSVWWWSIHIVIVLWDDPYAPGRDKSDDKKVPQLWRSPIFDSVHH